MAVFYGIKMILMLLGMAIAFPLVALKFGMTRNAMTYHGRVRRNRLLLARHGGRTAARRSGPSRFSWDCPTRST